LPWTTPSLADILFSRQHAFPSTRKLQAGMGDLALVGRTTFHLALPLGGLGMFMVTGGFEFGTEDATSCSCPRFPTVFLTSLAAISKTLINFNISLIL
jgi:hypothetical protein